MAAGSRESQAENDTGAATFARATSLPCMTTLSGADPIATDGASSSHTFTFNGQSVRTVGPVDAPWFVARDVCAVLDLTWSGATLASIPDRWRGVLKLNTPGGEQEFAGINEPAVYKLAFRSNKPEAETFTNWVAAEVLPAIRKTGTYSLPSPTPDLSDPLVTRANASRRHRAFHQGGK